MSLWRYIWLDFYVMIYLYIGIGVVVIFIIVSYYYSVKRTKKIYAIIQKNGWKIFAKDKNDELTEDINKSDLFNQYQNNFIRIKVRPYNIIKTGNGTVFSAKVGSRLKYTYHFYYNKIDAPDLIISEKKYYNYELFTELKELEIPQFKSHYYIYAKKKEEVRAYLKNKLQDLPEIIDNYNVIISKNRIIIYKPIMTIPIKEYQDYIKNCQKIYNHLR